MGNSPINCKDPLDGSDNDIFRLIFKPELKEDGIKLIARLVRANPDILKNHVSCAGLILDRVIKGLPLHLAIMYFEYSSFEIVKRIIELEPISSQIPFICDICKKTTSPIVALISDIHNNNKTYEILELLLTNGAKIQDSCQSALFTLFEDQPITKLSIKCLQLMFQYDSFDIDQSFYRFDCSIYGCGCSKYYKLDNEGLTVLDYIKKHHSYTKYTIVAIKMIEEYCIEKYNRELEEENIIDTEDIEVEHDGYLLEV